jgi:hypothetical protein
VLNLDTDDAWVRETVDGLAATIDSIEDPAEALRQLKRELAAGSDDRISRMRGACSLSILADLATKAPALQEECYQILRKALSDRDDARRAHAIAALLGVSGEVMIGNVDEGYIVSLKVEGVSADWAAARSKGDPDVRAGLSGILWDDQAHPDVRVMATQALLGGYGAKTLEDELSGDRFAALAPALAGRLMEVVAADGSAPSRRLLERFESDELVKDPGMPQASKLLAGHGVFSEAALGRAWGLLEDAAAEGPLRIDAAKYLGGALKALGAADVRRFGTLLGRSDLDPTVHQAMARAAAGSGAGELVPELRAVLSTLTDPFMLDSVRYALEKLDPQYAGPRSIQGELEAPRQGDGPADDPDDDVDRRAQVQGLADSATEESLDLRQGRR